MGEERSAGAHMFMVPSDAESNTGAANSTLSRENAESEHRNATIEEAASYLHEVENEFSGRPAVYNEFRTIFEEFGAQRIGATQAINRVCQLFQGHNRLLLGFNLFLPPDYKIELREGGAGCGYSLTRPSSTPPTLGVSQAVGATVAHQQGPLQQQMVHGTPNNMGHGTGISHREQARMQRGTLDFSPYLLAEQAEISNIVQHLRYTTDVSDPVAVEHFRSSERSYRYLDRIRTRYSENREILEGFTDVLRAYSNGQITIQQLSEEVSELFHADLDLIQEFDQFLPGPE